MRVKLTGKFQGYDDYLKGIKFLDGESTTAVAGRDVDYLYSEGIPFELLPDKCDRCELLDKQIAEMASEIEELKAQLAKKKK